MQLGSWHWALFVVLYERRRIAGVASLSPKSNRKSLAARIRRRYSVSGGWREATIENTCAFAGCIRCDTYRQLTLIENKCSFTLMLFIMSYNKLYWYSWTTLQRPLWDRRKWPLNKSERGDCPSPPPPPPPRQKKYGLCREVALRWTVIIIIIIVIILKNISKSTGQIVSYWISRPKNMTDSNGM